MKVQDYPHRVLRPEVVLGSKPVQIRTYHGCTVITVSCLIFVNLLGLQLQLQLQLQL